MFFTAAIPAACVTDGALAAYAMLGKQRKIPRKIREKIVPKRIFFDFCVTNSSPLSKKKKREGTSDNCTTPAVLFDFSINLIWNDQHTDGAKGPVCGKPTSSML